MKVVASITSKWNNQHGYSARNVARVSSYNIEAAMDTDTDSWSIDIGDPSFQLMDLLDRDNEVRVQLFAGGFNYGISELKGGFADSIGITHDGTLALGGRDLSAAAVDSTHLPHDWKHYQPDRIIGQEAKALGITNLALAKVSPFTGYYTDGSESYWEVWYRAYRKRKMWLWVDPAGTLIANTLNYGNQPSYFIGVPDSTSRNGSQWIKPSTTEQKKNTQARLGNVRIYGQTGKKSGAFQVDATDPTIRQWIKRPSKIITDSKSTTVKEALEEAWEEIFESKVGAIEITIQIADPGFRVLQNRIARVNIPSRGLRGDYFIVGVVYGGGPEGNIQTLRLREKDYAISRRVPTDPVLVKPKQYSTTIESGASLATSLGIQKADWGSYFLRAAQQNHGSIDLTLFLAILMAVCDTETNFQNEREGGAGLEWMPPPAMHPMDNQNRQNPGATGPVFNLAVWKKAFANSAGNSLNPYSREAGVGPFQLTTLSLKLKADGMVQTSGDPEYEGGRWHPEANIMVGAEYIASVLQGVSRDTNQILLHMGGYNAGPANWNSSAGQVYAKKIRDRVLGPDGKTGYLSTVTNALVSQTVSPANSTDTVAALPKNTPPSIRHIVNFLEHQEGKQYSQQNRMGPDSYDCSGLSAAAYLSIGIPGEDIGGQPFTTYSMWASGKGGGKLNPVKNQDQLLAGDFVFFDTESNGTPGHMGVYISDGMAEFAPHAGSVVHKESVASFGNQYMGAMRLPYLHDPKNSNNVGS